MSTALTPVPRGGIRLHIPGGEDQPDPGTDSGPRSPNRPPPPPPVGTINPPPAVNTAAPDPGLTDTTTMTRDYIKGIPGNVGDMTDVAGGKIRDSYAGANRADLVDATRRGVADTGIEGALHKRTEDDQARALAASATDIAIAGKAQAGQLLGTLGSQEAARAGIQQQQQQIGMQQSRDNLAAQQAMFNQAQAISGLYNQQHPRGYYDDSDPNTVKPAAGNQGPAGGLFIKRDTTIAGSNAGSRPAPMRTGVGG